METRAGDGKGWTAECLLTLDVHWFEGRRIDLIFELDNFSHGSRRKCLSPLAIFTHDNVFYRGYLALKSGYSLGHVEYSPTP